jgi:hypothetical protein
VGGIDPSPTFAAADVHIVTQKECKSETQMGLL